MWKYFHFISQTKTTFYSDNGKAFFVAFCCSLFVCFCILNLFCLNFLYSNIYLVIYKYLVSVYWQRAHHHQRINHTMTMPTWIIKTGTTTRDPTIHRWTPCQHLLMETELVSLTIFIFTKMFQHISYFSCRSVGPCLKKFGWMNWEPQIPIYKLQFTALSKTCASYGLIDLVSS